MMPDQPAPLSTPAPRIALALSGGGSRAMAFHLGCLRELDRVGLLQHVTIMSAVSGGSVLAALYCTTPGDFAAFEVAARQALRRGFVKPAIKQVFTSFAGINALLAFTAFGLDRMTASLVSQLLRLAPPVRRKLTWLRRSAIPRWASRTTILKRVFDKMLCGAKLSELRKDRPQLMIIACELRAKAAIYFTRSGIHCWRYGEAKTEDIALAQAVAASAAYPAALPALDERLIFSKAGKAERHRITLTDGGVYDNLGLAPFWPGRDPEISMTVPEFDRLIACRAGYSLSIGEPAAFMASRMLAVVSSIHARTENLAINRLFELLGSGGIGPVLVPSIGQNDERLLRKPDKFVSGEVVADYPTDFSAMSEAWIDKLSGRGASVMAALLAEHWPELTPGQPV